MAQNLLWLNQVGSDNYDVAWAVTPDLKGGVFAGGDTQGSLAAPIAGPRDACLLHFDGSGRLRWVRQFGTDQLEIIRALAPDGLGGVFACGETTGDLASQSYGGNDAFIARFDRSGARMWIRQIGVQEHDFAFAAAEDGSGGVFVAGGTGGALGGPFTGGFADVWVARYDAMGTQLWLHQFGSRDSEAAEGAASDGSGGVFLCGSTDGDLAGPSLGPNDAWIARLDATGNIQWIRQLAAASNEVARRAAPDGLGGVFVCGSTTGSLGGIHGGGYFDAWIARVDGTGNWTWIRQFGTSAWEETYVVAPDAHCGVFLGVFQVTGPGSASWLVRYNQDGTLLGAEATPHSLLTIPQAGAADGHGGLYLGGPTKDFLGGQGAGKGDIWLARYDGSCNAGTTYCVASSTSIPGCQASISATGSPALSDPTAWTITSGPVPGGNLGLLLFGSSGKDNTPYGTLGGQLCVASPTFRTAPKTSGGDQGQCNGSYAFTLADLLAASPIVASGATVNAQVWARDPANADGFMLSDGLEVVVCP